MFKGEKTSIFWVGLVTLSLASLILFSILWFMVFTISAASPYINIDYYWKALFPPVVGAVVFILVGLYMMRSGVKKEKKEIPGSPKLL